MTKNLVNNYENRFKIADVVAHLLAINGTKVVFGVSGGAALHLLDSISKHPDLKLITTHHEQAAAMAAESTSRIGNSLGVAVSTSGPGATNMITGIAGAFYDSVPSVFITGQVSTTRLSKDMGVRQIGFQETPIVDMVDKITKYAVQVTDPADVIRELELCVQLALSGRPGPTLFDIPDDIQRMFITLPNGLPTTPVSILEDETYDFPHQSKLEQLNRIVMESIRPVIVIGWGVHLAKSEKIIRETLDKLKWPTLLTWGAMDFLEEECEYRIGTFGTHGNRDSNFIIQNSDLIISIGSRLDTKSTGTPVSSFGKHAKIVMIDVDYFETNKFVALMRPLDLSFNFNLKSRFLSALLDNILNFAAPLNLEWINYTQKVRSQFTRKINESETKFVNPYLFISELARHTPSEARLYVDTGCSIAWVAQAWEFKKGQRLYHDFNNTAMGWALPASLPSLINTDKSMTIAIIGDGSFMMSIQELSTAIVLEKPIKIFILNNSGYAMIKQTQDQWFESSYFASNADSEMRFPNFSSIAQAFGYEYKCISADSDLDGTIVATLNDNASYICEVIISPDSRVSPQVKFGFPIERMDPPLDETLQLSFMNPDIEV